MGCDIHICVEVADDFFSTKQWELAIGRAASYSPRNYDVFAVLADVRNYGAIKPISAARGWPADMAPETKRQLESEDGHSESWLLLSEILAHPWPESCGWFVEWASSLVDRDKSVGRMRWEKPENIRLVFCFDN